MQEIEHRDRNGRPQLSQSNFRVPSSRSAYGSTPGWVEKATKDFLDDAGDTEPGIGIKKLPYTRPQLRETIKRRIMAGSDGGRPGQWSARKAQLVAQAYRRAGGGYRGKPGRAQRSLKKWTSERWTTSDGKPARRKGRMTRYLPAAAWKRLTPAQRRATIAKKLSGDRAGRQFVANTQRAASASKKIRSKTLGPSVEEVSKNPNAPQMFANSSSEEDRIVSAEPLEQPFSPNKEKLNEIGNAPSYGSNPPVKPFIPGNLDIDNREPIEKQNGSLALIEPTIIDGSGDEAGMFIIVPLITKFGQIIEPSNASSHFSKTSDHLGKFKSREDAEQYLEWLKDIEEEISYRDKKKPIISMHPIEKIVELAGDGFESRRQSIKNTIKRIADKYMTEKALGPTLRAANSVQIYDPDAIDADNDGLVQDATPWMRPALPSSPIIAGLRSAKNSNMVSQRAMKEAQEFANFVSQHEPELTEMMNGFANKKGSSLYLRGLKNRKKTAESLALKAQRLQHLFDGDLTDSITSMNDPLRYTFESDDVNNYTKDVLDVISALAKKGHKASVTNYWTSGDPYKGVNVMVDHPDGFFYEIQFHTPSSYRLKNKLTPLYEKYRDEKNVKKRQEIYDEMLKLSKGVSIPKDIGKFGEPLSRGSGKADFKPARPGKLIPTPLGLSSRRTGVSPARSRRIEADKPLPLSEISPDLSDGFPATNAGMWTFETIAQPPLLARFNSKLAKALRRAIGRKTSDPQKRRSRLIPTKGDYSQDETKDILKDVFRDDLSKLLDGTYLGMPARESLKEDRERLLNTLRIIFDTREGTVAVNLPTMHAEPYEPFKSMVDQEVDWSSIYIPTDQDAEDLFREINSLKIGNRQGYGEEYSPRHQEILKRHKSTFIADDNLPSTEAEIDGGFDETFIGIYEIGMRSPSLFGTDHDGMHLAVGRGFDRHGEYAAALAEVSYILQIPGMSDEDKNFLASMEMENVISTFVNGERMEDVLPNIDTTVYDMPKVFDAMIRRSTYKGVGGMSSRNSMRSIRSASEADIDAISQEYLGSERFSRRLSEVHGIESQIGMRSIRERVPMKEIIPPIAEELFELYADWSSMKNQTWESLNKDLEKRLLAMDGWTDAQKERIKQQVDNLLKNLRAMRDDWQSMGRRERSRILRRERIIDGFESHPAIDMNIDDIIKQAELRIHDDGTLSFKLPPNPILRELIPGDRNYQDVEVPDRETIRSIFDNLKGKLDTRQWYELFESIYQRVGGIAQLAVFPANGEELPHHSLYLPSYRRHFTTKFPGSSDAIQYRYNDIAARILQHYVGPELEKIKRNENPKIGKVVDDSDHYIHGYLGLMADPHGWREISQEIAKRFEVPPGVILHDVLGHYANGNTFDRHGEWGNILATIALARDKEFWEKLRRIPELADLTDEDREIFIRGLLVDVAAAWLHRIGYPDGASFWLNDIKEKINFYDGPIDELLDKLDPPSTRSQGGMSSTRRIPLTNMTDRQLVNLGLQSVDGVAIRGKLFGSGGMSSSRDDTLERNIDFVRKETARQQKLLATRIDEQFKEKWGPLFDILDMSLGLSESELRLQFVRNKEDYLLGKAGLLHLNNLMKSVREMPRNNPLNQDSEELQELIDAIQRFAPRTPKKEFVLQQARETLRLRKLYENSEYRKGINDRPMDRDFISPQEFVSIPYRGAWIYPDGKIYPVFWHVDEHNLLDSFDDGILRLDVARVTRQNENVHLNLEAKLEKLTPSQIEAVIELYENFGQPKLFWDIQSKFVSFDEDGEVRNQNEAARRKILRDSLSDGIGSESNSVKLVEIQPDVDELSSVGGMSSRRREMTDSEKERLIPITLAPDEKIKLQPGTTLVYTDEDDQIIRTELIGPQVARVRGIPRMKLYTDPNPDNQDEVDARMRQWEIDFGPISSDQRQARGRGSQPDRTTREQGRPRTTNEDPIDRILRETEEARSRRGLSSRTDENDENDDDDDDDDGLTPKERAAEKARMRAYEEFRKITPEERARREEIRTAFRAMTRSADAIEERRLARVRRNKGKETNVHNADGTMKNAEEQKLYMERYMERRGLSSRTDTYAILDGQDFEEILDELELNETEKDVARQALFQIYEYDNNSTFATRQKIIDKIKKLLSDNPTTPIDDKTKEAIESISIKVSSNGIPVIFAQPHPTIGSILPNRDWSEIEAPSAEYLASIFRELRYRIKNAKKTSYKNKLRVGAVTERSYRARQELKDRFTEQFRDIIRKLQSRNSDAEYNYNNYKQLDGSWVQQYVSLLLNPARGSAIPDVEHDILGHFGTGRGFDRHGEWANAMAITSFILDSDLLDLTEEERDAMAFWWLGEYGIPQIFKQIYPKGEESEELQGVANLLGKIRFGEYDDAFDGSTRELVALLDAENINREGIRSASTPSIKLTEASPELLLRADNEASKDRSEFVLKSTLENLSSRPDKNEIISGMSSRTNAYFIPQKDRLRLTDGQKQRIAELNAEGLTDMQIARELGISKESVIRVRKKENIPAANRPSKNEERNKKIISMVKQGMTHTRIAKELGIHKQSVMDAVLRHARDTGENYSSFDARDIPRRNKIIELNKLGKTDVEIAREVGVSPNTVGRIRKQEGLTINFPGKTSLDSSD